MLPLRLIIARIPRTELVLTHSVVKQRDARTLNVFQLFITWLSWSIEEICRFNFMGAKIVFMIYCQREFLNKVNSFLRLWLSDEFIFKFVARWLSSVVWRLHFVLQLTKVVNCFDDFYNSKLHLVIPRCMRVSRVRRWKEFSVVFLSSKVYVSGRGYGNGYSTAML